MPISFDEDDPKNENIVLLAARFLPLSIRHGTSTNYTSKKALDRSAMYMGDMSKHVKEKQVILHCRTQVCSKCLSRKWL